MGRDDDEPIGSRYPSCLGPSRAVTCIACVIAVAGGAYYANVADPSEQLLAMLLRASCRACAASGVLIWRNETRKRLILYAAGRIMFLAKSLPRQTDGETLAVVGEIRARYAEARGLVEEIDGDSGRRLADDLRGRLDRIDRGTTRRSDSSVVRMQASPTWQGNALVQYNSRRQADNLSARRRGAEGQPEGPAPFVRGAAPPLPAHGDPPRCSIRRRCACACAVTAAAAACHTGRPRCTPLCSPIAGLRRSRPPGRTPSWPHVVARRTTAG